MAVALFVANLVETITADDLRALFAAHGEVTGVEIAMEPHVQQPVAVVEMATEKQATRALNALNGTDLAGKRLYVSYYHPDFDRDMTPRQRKTVQEIVALLGETEAKPLRQIEAIVYLCGGRFAEALAEEALAIDAQEGMFTADGTRRTKGGIFFYLARFHMSPEARRIVYNRRGKLPTRR